QRARPVRWAFPTLLAALVASGAVGFVWAPSAATHAAIASKVDPGLAKQAHADPASLLPVIVREREPRSDRVEGLFDRLGGHVTRELPLVGSFAGTLPASSLDLLAHSPDVVRLWGNARLTSDIVDVRQYDTWVPNTVWRS